tara:strand:+ start:35 stop:388 length:354 start_codon:yes stop_codon:yes gene_type:complete
MQKTKLPTITFAKANALDNEGRAFLVVRGGGSEKYQHEWIEAINNGLIEQGITSDPLGQEAYSLPVREGRDDLLLAWDTVDSIDSSKLALWRLKANMVGWSISWLEDYIVNDAGEFK